MAKALKAAKKTTGKVVARKTAKPAVVAKKRPVVKEAFNKTQILNAIAELTELTKKQVSLVLDELVMLIESHVKQRGPGEFTIPGLLKIKTIRKPATKARKGTNPFTGQETMFKAKPARTVVKIKALKKLKDMVA